MNFSKKQCAKGFKGYFSQNTFPVLIVLAISCVGMIILYSPSQLLSSVNVTNSLKSWKVVKSVGKQITHLAETEQQ